MGGVGGARGRRRLLFFSGCEASFFCGAAPLRDAASWARIHNAGGPRLNRALTPHNLYADWRVWAKDKALMRPHVGGSDATRLEIYLAKRFADLLLWIKVY